MTIFRHFAGRTRLPVKIDEIADWIKTAGFANEILYHPMDMSPAVVSGLVRVIKYRPPYAIDDVVRADIPFSTQLPEPNQRVVGAKELIHILDKDEYVAASYEAVGTLISEIVIPVELSADIPRVTGMGLWDHSGILTALAVLLPPAAREVLIELRQKGHIGNKEAAALANLPEEYMNFLLGDRWGAMLVEVCK
jgi:hypothetical protein